MEGQRLVSFRLRLRLRAYDDRLVERVEKTLGDDVVEALRDADAKLSQLSAFLNSTLQAPSAPVVAEWVRYQMARGATRGQWQETGLGRAVLDEIAALEGEANRLAGYVYPADQREQGEKDVWIELVRRYAGWLRRKFVAEMGGEADDQQ